MLLQNEKCPKRKDQTIIRYDKWFASILNAKAGGPKYYSIMNHHLECQRLCTKQHGNDSPPNLWGDCAENGGQSETDCLYLHSPDPIPPKEKRKQ